MKEPEILLGCVADDFTGAGDAASFLTKGGLSVQLFNGIPKKEDEIANGIQAVVIALKSRTQKTQDAVTDTMNALRWLAGRNTKQFYLKYCSTFDSTPQGNIGPIADAAMRFLKVPYTILCPALPANGRVVRHGELWVNGVPLHESPMKNHPLTPMWDCRIRTLMEPQSSYPCVEIGKEQTAWQEPNISRIICNAGIKNIPFYIIPDYWDDSDGERIVDQFGNLTLLTGGSGILEPLARKLSSFSSKKTQRSAQTSGNAIILAGSCSKATLEQIAYFKNRGGLSYHIDPVKMIKKQENVEKIWKFIEQNSQNPILVYSSDNIEKVRQAQTYGRTAIAEMLEQTMAVLAKRAIRSGIRRIIVAGGETSGAVTKELGFSSYQIAENVAPGVPVMIPLDNLKIRLILKSGNFGSEDFFEKALTMTESRE